jgi:hypothetical protein
LLDVNIFNVPVVCAFVSSSFPYSILKYKLIHTTYPSPLWNRQILFNSSPLLEVIYLLSCNWAQLMIWLRSYFIIRAMNSIVLPHQNTLDRSNATLGTISMSLAMYICWMSMHASI